MANLEYIHYIPHRPEVHSGAVNWLHDGVIRGVDDLPQIFWKTGEPWREANVWALELARNRDLKLKTVHGLFGHLYQYAVWLEREQIDWRHFPQTKSERVLTRYRGFLIESREHRLLKPSTTTARMNAVIRFYRYAAGRNFVSRDVPKFEDQSVVLRYFDTAGFERTMTRMTTDISIPNRARSGLRLEDGLLPISRHHMTELLQFTKANCSEELHLMLMVAFFTGARSQIPTCVECGQFLWGREPALTRNSMCLAI
jgi:hypothetical protein